MIRRLAKILEVLRTSDLLTVTVNIPADIDVCYPETDTRKLNDVERRDNSLTSFICIKGYTADGHEYAKAAVDQGAGLIFCERILPHVNIPMVIVKNSRKTLALLAKLFYDDPSSKFKLIGITGTNGKTSIVKIIEHILLKSNKKTATIGTLGYTINGQEFPLERTTPDITELNSLLSNFAGQNIECVVMEVSSHALKLDRVFGLSFDYALFTNLSREHLDFHPDMEDYYLSKKLLFDYLTENDGTALINTGDKYGKRLFESLSGKRIDLSEHLSEHGEKILSNSNDRQNLPDSVSYIITGQSLKETKIDLYLQTKTIATYKIPFKTKLIGTHNAFNTSAALIMSSLLLAADKEESPASFIEISKDVLPERIKGRLELVDTHTPVHCYIDYAHTPEALKSTCKTLKELINTQNNSINSAPPETLLKEGGSVTRPQFKPKQRLICLYGAGGNRDKGKRAEMTEAVLEYADIAIISSDNPRNENPSAILFDLIEDLHPLSPYFIISDRKEAIKAAVTIANDNDIILIAGKGHEKYQIIGDKKYRFDDYREAHYQLTSKADQLLPDQFDLEASASSPTTKLAVPFDLLQLKILLGYCNKEDLAVNRWIDEAHTHDNEKMKEVRAKIFSASETVPLSLNIPNRLINCISTDTRSIVDSSCFIALQGENFDGHNYLQKALNFDNNTAIVAKKWFAENSHSLDNERFIVVDDTLTALALIAKKYQTLFNKTTIAITGSTGKTSVKEYCCNVLSQHGKTLKNVANENNIIGVSRTILNLNSSYRYMVLEAGTNQVGEMQVIADTVEPDIAMITNIGECHLEAFKNLKGVYAEKITLLNRNLKFRIVPYNDKLFEKYRYPALRIAMQDQAEESNGKDTVKFRIKHQLSNDSPSNTKKIFTEREYRVYFPSENSLKGRQENIADVFELPVDIPFLADNAAFAVTVGLLNMLDKEAIQTGLLYPQRLKNRMEIINYNNRKILSDCYNANPASMEAAIDYWTELAPDLTHIAVLGDMLELGEQSVELHKRIGMHLKEKTANRKYYTFVYTVGELARFYEGNFQYRTVEELQELNDRINPFAVPNSVILIKGSRGIHLEKLLTTISMDGIEPNGCNHDCHSKENKSNNGKKGGI